ncbi:alpha-1,3-mannosyl-glycoprotein 2-beta-N-acetylglucosaminyltransferase isoform X2 [Spodoptera frugiperda]|uniref:Alpha-1,3-mannosyl-glycoprotein 2-beta-N-acetylglucosaminyltransferase n=1 Tax=Spodoptera frugiperda TaxID=7108 RepID=A0A9R0E319_SPOFR|nr:alpha-1,3-mannosyl-glycoprotein 2-beta-N-acetylglucosaminyltransferase isoform X1 [Spodoptera frugiperda]XP_050558338.1 alpha-1,3-mannosyl-glycoprotein 2-beta-N-acetylglucosaminyltransferase isoform X2 [Spodoptera frugiperda]
MRLNVKKALIFVGCVVFLWVLLSYASVIEVPRAVPQKDPAVEIEKKIIKLQKQVDAQMAESKSLLAKVKKLKKISEGENVGGEEDSLKDSEVMQHLSQPILPVLVIACDRVTVQRCLDNLVKFRPSKETFPIIVSQDCGHNATYEVITSYTASDPTISVVRQPDLSEIVLPRVKVKFRGYYKIARHYKFALNHVFETLGHEAVIIVEDDLDISPDFFEYFLGTYPLLLKDPSLWCISAWNDNGKMEVIDMSRPDLLHRTDFFPGLGWVLRREMWRKLAPKWPTAFFDDWLRNPVNIDGKACIRPEISRTYSFGKVGVSKGLFFDLHLRNIQLNMEYVEFTKLNLTYLLKDHYDDTLTSTVYNLPEMSASEVVAGSDLSADPVRVMYSNAKTYQRAAKKLGLMDDFRSGVPRTAYRGIVTCFIRGRRVYLAPSFEWNKYDPTWG